MTVAEQQVRSVAVLHVVIRVVELHVEARAPVVPLLAGPLLGGTPIELVFLQVDDVGGRGDGGERFVRGDAIEQVTAVTSTGFGRVPPGSVTPGSGTGRRRGAFENLRGF
jgi:hypothetical protein